MHQQNTYAFGGCAMEDHDYYSVLVYRQQNEEEMSVNFYRNGAIEIYHSPLVTIPTEDVDAVITAAKHPQVVEQLALFMAGKPCCDLTDMPCFRS